MCYRLPEINDDSFCFDMEHQTGAGRASRRPWIDDFSVQHYSKDCVSFFNVLQPPVADGCFCD